jgi:pilus assembly protein CpaF
VRGAETLDMLQAMNTGHEGSLTTIHANSPRDALNRLETMVLMSGIQFPLKAIREQVASALDLIVHLTRLVDGSRKVHRVTEVIGMESDVVTLQDVFLARPMDERAAATGDPGVLLRPLEPSGLQPHFRHKLAAQGVEIPEDFYRPQRQVAAVGGGWGR